LRCREAIPHRASSCCTPEHYNTSGARQHGRVPCPFPWHPWLSLLRNISSIAVLRSQFDFSHPLPSPLSCLFSSEWLKILYPLLCLKSDPQEPCGRYEQVGTNAHTRAHMCAVTCSFSV